MEARKAMASRKLHPMEGSAPNPLLNERQIGVLASICEILVPSIDDPGSPSLGENDWIGNVGTIGTNRGPGKVHHSAGGHEIARGGQEQHAAPPELPKFFALSGSASGTPEAVAGLYFLLSVHAIAKASFQTVMACLLV